METMYYPSLFSSVQPLNQPSAPLGNTGDVPVMPPGREREIPLDLSVKTIRQTPDSTADAEVFMLEHRKLAALASQTLPNMNCQMTPSSISSAPSILDPSFFQQPYRTDSNARVNHSVLTMAPSYCVERTSVCTTAPSAVNHPVVTSLLHQSNKYQEKKNVATTQPTTSNLPYVDQSDVSLRMTSRSTTVPQGERKNIMSHRQYSWTQAQQTSVQMPNYMTYSNVLPNVNRGRCIEKSSRTVPEKSFVNGNNLETKHASQISQNYNDHLQHIPSQRTPNTPYTGTCCLPVTNTVSHSKTVNSQYTQHISSQVSLSNHNMLGAGKDISVAKLCNGTQTFVSSRMPALGPQASNGRLHVNPYSSSNNHNEDQMNHLVPQSTLWNSSMFNLTLPSAVAPAALSHVRRKEGASSSQKESPRTARDFPGPTVPGRETPLLRTEFKNREPQEVIVIDDESGPTNAYSVPVSKNAIMNRSVSYANSLLVPNLEHTSQRLSGGLKGSHTDSDILAPPAKMPCLEAVSPNDNRKNTENSASSPLGPPPLIAAASPVSDTGLKQLNEKTVVNTVRQPHVYRSVHALDMLFESCRQQSLPLPNGQLKLENKPSIITGQPRPQPESSKYSGQPRTGNILPIASNFCRSELEPSITSGRPRQLAHPSLAVNCKEITSKASESPNGSVYVVSVTNGHFKLENEKGKEKLSDKLPQIRTQQKSEQGPVKEKINSTRDSSINGHALTDLLSSASDNKLYIQAFASWKNSKQASCNNQFFNSAQSGKGSGLLNESRGQNRDAFQKNKLDIQQSSSSQSSTREIASSLQSPKNLQLSSQANGLSISVLSNATQSLPTPSFFTENTSHSKNATTKDTYVSNKDGEKPVLKKLLTRPALRPMCSDFQDFFPESDPGSSGETVSEADALYKMDPTSEEFANEQCKSGRKRSMLECLANSEGYVAEKKRRKTTDLFADPSQLSREERALQRAMLRFEELEQQNHNVEQPPATRLRSSRTTNRLKNVTRGRSGHGMTSVTLRYSTQIKKYNKNAAYEEELRREAKRLAGFRAKRKLRRRLLARLYQERKEPQMEAEKSEKENENTLPDQSRRILSPLNVHWRQKRINYSCQVVRRRRLRSGLDMIARRKKPKPPSLQKEGIEQQRQKSISEDSVMAKALSEQGTVQGSPLDLKKLIVNKALGETVLHRAARIGYIDVVLYCLDTKFCDVNVRDNAGYTPLHECCSRGHLSIACALLQYGADVNASAAGGIRPMHDAVENDHVELVRLLLSYGADPVIATYSGLTPLKLARSAMMSEFFKGFMADIADTDASLVAPWQFEGSASILDPTENGFNVCDDVPSDPEEENDDDFLFEVSDTPHLPTFRLQLKEPSGKVLCNCLRLSDILKQTGLIKEEFQELHRHVCIITIPRHEFESSVTCSQLLTGTKLDRLLASDGTSSSASTVDIVKLDNNIREILDIETVSLR